VRIEDLSETIRAGSDVRQDERRLFAGGLTRTDLKRRVTDRVEKGGL
jgi:hypothetical protein